VSTPSSVTFAVLVNRSGGSSDADRRAALEAALDDAGLTYRIHEFEGDPADAAREAVDEGCGALVAGGGDGTIGSVAAVAVEAGLPFGVVPLGTFNNFARDLGVPLDPAEAVAVLAAGRTRKVDLGRIGETVFVNNASIGAYATLVVHRERAESDAPKWRAAITAARTVFPYRPDRVTIHVDDEEIDLVATLVFIGNNEYVVDGRRFTRERLDQGELVLYAIRADRVRDAARVAYRIARGHLDRERDVVHRTGRRIRISTRSRTVLVAHDGEVERMPVPLELTTSPGALEVYSPADGPDAPSTSP
jgi:diacylglycerol kinase family enzyme